MNREQSFIPPRHVGSLTDSYLVQAVCEYRRVERLLARNPSVPGTELREQLQATLSLLQAEAARRAAQVKPSS